jgi:hypothetical protein
MEILKTERKKEKHEKYKHLYYQIAIYKKLINTNRISKLRTIKSNKKIITSRGIII